MKNRIIENWLTKSSERAYKIPFCQLLISKGYKVIHNTRDGPFEQGKDVLAVDPKGNSCAFQLKRGDIKQKDWQQFKGEIEQLIEIPIIHPSVPKSGKHASFLVTNGQLSEEVRREIDDRNDTWKKKGYPQLKTWVGGELLGDFQKYYGDFFPTEIKDLSEFLTLYQEDGKEPLNKELYTQLLETILPIATDDMSTFKKTAIAQAINNSVVLTSYILGNKYQSENHIAIIDGWIILLASVFATVEKFNLQELYWKQSVDLIWSSAIEGEFQSLEKELIERTHYTEGDALADVAVYRARVSVLSGYLSGYEIFRFLKDEKIFSEAIKNFLDDNPKRLVLLGESMTPLLLNVVFYRQIVGNDNHSRILLMILLQRILNENEPYKGEGLPDPHHGIEELLRWQFGLIKDIQGEGFKGISYSLKSIIMIMVSKNMRIELEQRWLKISHLQYSEFLPDKPWHILKWDNSEGHHENRFPNQTQSWKELQNEAEKDYSSTLPEILLKYPEFIPLFLCVFPQRLTPSLVLFLFKKISLI